MQFMHLRNSLISRRFSLIRYCINNELSANVATRSDDRKERHFSSKVAAKPNGRLPPKGPGLKEFLIAGKNSLVAQPNPITPDNTVPYLNELDYNGHGRKVFFEVYGCQMNVNDTEIVWSILKDNGYKKVETVEMADVVLLMTCAIREKAETKVSQRNKNPKATKPRKRANKNK